MKNQEELKSNLIAFLDNFPTNAVLWSQATDEIRDLARMVREYYNEHVLDVSNPNEGLEPVNFRIISNPAEWNSRGRKFILTYWEYLPREQKLLIDDYISE